MSFSSHIAKLDPWRLTIRSEDPRLKALPEEETARLRAAQIRAILSLTPTLVGAQFAVIGILCAVFWHRGHDVFLLVWGGALSLAFAFALANWRAMAHLPLRSGASWRGTRRLTINGFVLGALWATPIVYLFEGSAPHEAVILASLAAGLVSGGALVMATVFQAALAFTLAVMIPSLGNLIWLGGPMYLFLAGMTASFTLIVARTVYKHADLFIDSHLADAKLRQQAQIIGLLLKDFEEGASDFLWETDVAARLTRVSGRLAELVGVPAERLEGRNFGELIGELGDEPPAEPTEIANLLTAREPFRDRVVGLRIRGERRRWQLTGKPIVDFRDGFRGFRGVGSDVTDAERLANYDPLTGLPNRRMFERETEAAIARLIASGTPFAVMTVDLDRFKRVNDTLGHAVGDALLCSAASRISRRLGERGLVTRFGGDEFVLLRECDDANSARTLSAALIADFAEPFEIGDFRVMVGASVGIALGPRDGTTFDALLRHSDLALYRAKSDGRGMACFFAASLDEAMQERRQLEVDLRAARDAGELTVYYQPLVDMLTGAITTCEALLRWRHPRRGDVPPSDFIPLAEETGLVSALGEWVLEQACRDASAWLRPARVAVNVSVIQFRMGGLDRTIARVLESSGLAPDRLEIEITESALIENAADTQRTLRAIRDLGVRISLDDFGAGCSSLSYLCAFPFEKIKIDKSLVHAMEDARTGAVVVRAIAALAQSIGVRLTAEGVETEAQLARLTQLGCREAQGYLFSRPLPARDIAALLGPREPRGEAASVAV